jgi:phage-related protein
MRDIKFYKTTAGKCPVREFVYSLPTKQREKVTWVFDIIKTQERVSSQFFKRLVGTEEIWEIRVQTGGDIFRFLGFFEGRQLVILTHAFQKKTQKTPQQDIHHIHLAEQRKRDYLNRRRNNDFDFEF